MKNQYFVKTISMRIITSVLLIMMLGVSNAIVLPVFAEDSKIPDWVRNISKWWSEGKVSDQEFINAIKYLVEKKIMQIDLSTSKNIAGSIVDEIKENPSVETDKAIYKKGEEIKISGSGFEKGELVIVVGNEEYLSLLDKYATLVDWKQIDLEELAILLQYQYSDSGDGTWEKTSYPKGFAISSKAEVNSLGYWEKTLTDYQAYEKGSDGKITKTLQQLPPDEYIIKIAQKIYNEDSLSYSGSKQLLLKTAYTRIIVE
ncbi:MAG: hypothetical protein HY295_01830 [Thaumarchaeota archaeon]|nr:hypothetical protein [Nitrososphaerota archaeon]